MGRRSHRGRGAVEGRGTEVRRFETCRVGGRTASAREIEAAGVRTGGKTAASGAGWLGLLILLAAPAFAAGPRTQEARAGDSPATPPLLTLEALEIAPASPTPETLLQLRVTVKNAGEKAASQLGFRLFADGREIPAYRKRLLFLSVAPGGTAVIHLGNLWSTEAGRPYPEGGRLRITVRLEAARWFDIETLDGEERWVPVGEVRGLPMELGRVVELRGEPPERSR